MSDSGDPIWLVGMMGAGKSVVGRALAKRLGRGFADTDADIERAAGITVSEIFASEGEKAFRARERKAIDVLCAGDDVVALGGGAIAQSDAAAVLAASGCVVYLCARVDTLLERVGDCAGRPLLADLDAEGRATKLAELLARREAAYTTAKLAISTDGLAVEQVVDAIVSALDESRAAT